jgi:hypothetical protein
MIASHADTAYSIALMPGEPCAIPCAACDAAEIVRLQEEVQRLTALLAGMVREPKVRKIARKIPAAAWPGRRAMVDDPEAGFVALDYLAAGRAGWVAPSHAANLDPWMLAAPIPADMAGWDAITYTLQGGKAEDHGRTYYPPDGEQAVMVAGWAETRAYHAAVCIPAMAAAERDKAAAVEAARKASAAYYTPVGTYQAMAS